VDQMTVAERLTPRRRIECAAAILAQGILRLRALDLAPKVSPATDQEISVIPLELSAETRLSGDSGLPSREARKQNEPTRC
jgi:hypothetical protein